MTISTISDCERVLESYIPRPSQNHSGALTTEHAMMLSRAVGSPHEKLKIIHVAGTSGKTSTCYFIASLLAAGGSKVGLTISPHITSVAERVQINGESLSERQFVQYFIEFHELVLKQNQKDLSYFEFLMVFALWVFMKEGVDYGVVETGLGGLYDASNIIHNDNKVAVITDIGLDHINVLGDTLEEIAAQKAGIIWPRNHVFCYEQSPEVMRVIKEYAQKRHAKMHVTLPGKHIPQSDVPLFQQRNWALAKHVYDFVSVRDSLKPLSTAKLDTTMHTEVPARMEIHKIGTKTLVIDGAHNEQKMTTFFDSFQEQYPDSKPTILLALKVGKELDAVSRIIAEHADEVIVTEFTNEQDMPLGAMEAIVIADALKARGVPRVTVQKNVRHAVNELLESNGSILLVIGSFFLASEVRPLL